jgi:RNA polymerase sigma-70 factor (ECF subfamily)
VTSDARPGLPDPLDSAAALVPAGEMELVQAILNADRKAAAQFVARYTDAVYGYVRHRLAPRLDLVDDLVQDVFVAALTGLPRFRGTSPLLSWLLGIARHKVEDHYRAQLRAPDALDDAVDDEPPAQSTAVDELLDRERLRSRAQLVLQQMPVAYAIALLWRYWEGRNAREMAEATGRTEKAIERLLARARAQFRRRWEESAP